MSELATSAATAAATAASPTSAPGQMRRIFDSDLSWSYRHSPVAIVASIIATTIIVAAFAAPWIAPHDPYDLASLSLMDATDPPAWVDGGNWSYPLGTDNQGRDVLSTILYGARLSLFVGVSAVVLALLLGVTLGLVAGWRGGVIETLIMRVADVQLSFPAILIALLIDGVARSVLPRDVQGEIALYVLVAAIALSAWVQYARTVRGSTLVERNKEYIQAARVIGVHPVRIVLGHLLPNVLGPVLVIATINLALAILTEATLSFLGVGLPPTEPSLGTLIRVGNDYLLSGDWWISIFPGIVLALLILSVNLLGDWLRDALNPKLR
ncbi:MAG TPA: ABC transporter permease [Stellaceae bacterium]|jgi:peptide/nickel transport system permease protein|nr:ABC transporter permease [Stellaceae bacterium]